MERPVSIIPYVIYENGGSNTNEVFRWTTDYCYELNELCKQAISATNYAEFLADTLNQRIFYFFNATMWTSRREWKASAFYRDMVRDMQLRGRRFTLSDRMYLALPARRLRRFFTNLGQVDVSTTDFIN